MVTIFFVRHGEVYNPQGIIYGQLPGFGLSTVGQAQIAQAAELLSEVGPFQTIYASPLQRAQESGAILAARLSLTVETETQLMETGIGGYQGQPGSALPHPYITELPTHPGIESAASIRQRMVAWADAMLDRHPQQQIIAVSHRDPIIVALLHWMGQGLEHLPGFDLSTGGVYKVVLTGSESAVERVI